MRVSARRDVYIEGHLSVALIRSDPFLRRINRKLQIIAADPIALRIRIGEGASLKHFIVREIKTVH
ncbi:hypothetical protein D3C71_2167380 [compost metagenome]